MNPTIDILRGELERLFSLEELTQMSQKLLGLDPQEVGGATAKASFARALTERCLDGERLDALVDVVLASRREVDPRLRDANVLYGKEELAPGARFGEFTIEKKIGESDVAYVYLATRGNDRFALKVLRRDAIRDRRSVHRYLTASRFVSTVVHDGLPRNVEAGEIGPDQFYVAYTFEEAPTLAARFKKSGPVHIRELRPMLRGILEPLAALHRAQIAHGSLKLENVLVGGSDDEPRVVLLDVASDKLRHRGGSLANGQPGLLAVYGSPKTIAPEMVRGKVADARSDVYAFGAMLYELLSGKPVFEGVAATEAVFAHLSQEVVPPSEKAPRGWVGKDVDAFVLSLLAKDPSRRPRDAAAILEQLDSTGRSPQSMRPGLAAAPASTMHVDELISRLAVAPADADSAMMLEQVVDEGAEPSKVAEAFASAADQITAEDEQSQDVKKSLLYRAARIWNGAVRDKERAEAAYLAITEMDPADDVALSALEQVRRSLGKFEEIVEMLLAKSQAAPPGADRGRAFAEIGRLCATELDDREQALVAYTQALCEVPSDIAYASEVERLCGNRAELWTETLTTMTDAIKGEDLSPQERNVLLLRAGRWYDAKLSRADLALMAYQQILATDPANEHASEALTVIYRKAEQWPELVNLLLARSDSATTTHKARDLRIEAAEILETKLGDAARAQEMYTAALADDPGHARAAEALARLAEAAGDYPALVRILEKRVEARRGAEKADALARVAEVYEDQLSDLAEATRRYEAALAVDASNMSALKGLDRIFNRTGRYRELLEILEKQISVAATPRQKVNLYERIAALYDEEFIDHTSAASILEQILSIDPANDTALSGLARHYRALDKWEQVVKIYDRHAAATPDANRRIELLLTKARTLVDPVGSPERAMRTYEQVLELSPGNANALEAIAHLKEVTGDAHAALSAIETLAEKAETAEARSEQWIRAGRLLEARGDRDGAIDRYKRALDANPRDAAAASAIRKAYMQRGDAESVVALIESEISHAEGDLARSRLLAELAKVFQHQLLDSARAEGVAKQVLEIDSTNADALMVLGDIAFEGQRFIEATRYYETLVGRAQILAKEDAVRVLVQFIESYGKTARPPASTASMSSLSVGDVPSSSTIPVAPSIPPPVVSPKLTAAIDALQQLAPGDVHALSRAANALFEFGDPAAAYRMHEELFIKYGHMLAGDERAEALYHLGESARRKGDLDVAIGPLKEAADLDPSNPKPFKSLARVYEAKEDWARAIRIRRRRLELATGGERFELLLEIGDVEFLRLGDRASASKTYVAALEERPEDRKLLTKLMQLYSEEKDWEKLVNVVLRLADFVEDPKQRAKYMQTAATISARQLHQNDKALEFYARALEFDPTLVKALDEIVELYRAKNDHDHVETYLNRRLEVAKGASDVKAMVKVLDSLGELYQKFLKEPELAIDAYEAAQAFDPEAKHRADILALLYASDPKQYLDKAVKAQAVILSRNPYRVESYKLLRKLYTDAKKPDPAWCLCQALSVLKLAEPDEERFYKKHRAQNAAPAQAALDDADWNVLAHGDLDPIVTKIFALIQPTIARVRTQPIAQLGYDARHMIDPANHPHAVVQTLYYAQGVLGVAPPVFQNPNDAGAFGFIHATPAALMLGRAAFEAQASTQAMAYIAGRHLTYYRPGYYVRQLVPTGTGLKAWLFAAIKMSVPQFPITPDMQAQVAEAMEAILQDFNGTSREKLASVVSKLLQSGGSLDLKKWVAAVDLTADRAGLLLAHDLETATTAVRATEAGSTVPAKERLKETVLFSVSEAYMGTRKKLGIAIDS